MSSQMSVEELVAPYHPVTPTSIIVVGVALPVLAAIAVALRFRIKIVRRTGIGLDDWLICFSLILLIAVGIIMIVGSAVHALAQPTPLGKGPGGFAHVKTWELTFTFKTKYAINIIQTIAFGSIKLSVLLFYRRIFRGKWFDIATWTLIITVILWTLGFTIVFIFQCKLHFWALWTTLFDMVEHCVQGVVLSEALTLSDVLTDALILSVPVPCIWALKLSRGRKIGICGVFVMGFLVVAFGLVRHVVMWKQLKSSRTTSQGILLMSTWDYWTLIEMGMAIVAACLPSLRPLFSPDGPFAKLSEALSSFVSTHKPHSTKELHHKESQFIHQDGASSSSKTKFAIPTNTYTESFSETFAMKDIENQLKTVPGKITVQQDFQQQYSTSSS